MQGTTHALVGLLIATLLVRFMNSLGQVSLFSQLLVFTLVLFGSLFPDIDSVTSILGRKTKLFAYVFDHRGFFHSLVLLLLVSIILSESLFFFAGMAFFLGMLSHLILDAITKEGLRPFFFTRRIKGPFVVGGFLETIFRMILFILLVLVLI